MLEETPIINGMKISLTPEQARDLPYPLGCKFLCDFVLVEIYYAYNLQLQCCAHLMYFYWCFEIICISNCNVGVAHLV